MLFYIKSIENLSAAKFNLFITTFKVIQVKIVHQILGYGLKITNHT